MYLTEKHSKLAQSASQQQVTQATVHLVSLGLACFAGKCILTGFTE